MCIQKCSFPNKQSTLDEGNAYTVYIVHVVFLCRQSILMFFKPFVTDP